MNGLRTLVAAITSLAMAGPALSGSYICAEDDATGFSWTDGKWVQAQFFTSSYFIQELDRSDSRADSCFATMQGRDMSPEIKSHGQFGRSAGCYLMSRVGEDIAEAGVHLCEETFAADETLRNVACTFGNLARFTFQPDGEFGLSRTYAIGLFMGSETRAEERDSLALTVGKCNTVVP